MIHLFSVLLPIFYMLEFTLNNITTTFLSTREKTCIFEGKRLSSLSVIQDQCILYSVSHGSHDPRPIAVHIWNWGIICLYRRLKLQTLYLIHRYNQCYSVVVNRSHSLCSRSGVAVVVNIGWTGLYP